MGKNIAKKGTFSDHASLSMRTPSRSTKLKARVLLSGLLTGSPLGDCCSFLAEEEEEVGSSAEGKTRGSRTRCRSGPHRVRI